MQRGHHRRRRRLEVDILMLMESDSDESTIEFGDKTTVRLPDHFYVFVTTGDPVVRWNIDRIKNISSSGFAAYHSQPEVRALYDAGEDEWLPFIPNPKFQTFLSFQAIRTTTNYRAEYHAECVRRRYFRNAPSRLAAVFAWGSLEEARLAATAPGGRYRGCPLKRCVLASAPLRAVRVNSEVVPLAEKMESSGSMPEEVITHVWSTYWSGSPDQVGFNRVVGTDLVERKDFLSRPEPTWEWIIDGSFNVVDDIKL